MHAAIASRALAPPTRRPPRTRLRLLALVALLTVPLVAGLVYWHWDNYHVVVPGRYYRSAQPDPDSLVRHVRHDNLRSVINLRGAHPDQEWYRQERAVADAHGLCFFDMGLWAQNPPTGERLEEFIRLLEECPKPVLIHCQSGIDRTGVVAAISILLEEDGSPEKALAQFDWCYGNFPWRKQGQIQKELILSYQKWLADTVQTHTPERFRHWATLTAGPRTDGTE